MAVANPVRRYGVNSVIGHFNSGSDHFRAYEVYRRARHPRDTPSSPWTVAFIVRDQSRRVTPDRAHGIVVHATCGRVRQQGEVAGATYASSFQGPESRGFPRTVRDKTTYGQGTCRRDAGDDQPRRHEGGLYEGVNRGGGRQGFLCARLQDQGVGAEAPKAAPLLYWGGLPDTGAARDDPAAMREQGVRVGYCMGGATTGGLSDDDVAAIARARAQRGT
jgi:hypothetical protein